MVRGRGEVDRDVGDDAARARRQHDDPVGDRIASGMLWVTMTIVVAARSQRRSSSRSNRSRVSASSALNGSSSSSTSGSSASARREGDALAGPAGQLATGARRRRPGRGRRARSARPGARRGARRGQPGELERVRDVGRGRPPRQQARLLEDEPDPRVGAGDRRSRRAAPCPAVGSSRPAMTRRSVDLPQPFGPMRATMPAARDRRGRCRRGPAACRRRGSGRRTQVDSSIAPASSGAAARGTRDASRSCRVLAERPQDRRRRRVEGDVRGVRPVVERRRMLAARLEPARRSRVIARIAAGRSG